MAGSTKPCLFCGAVGVKLTNEDVYPKWLRRALHIRGEVTYPVAGEPLRVSPVLDVRLRDVCAPCNNVWLHDLEEQFRQLMFLPMNGLAGLRISEQIQRMVALWAVKTYTLLERAQAHLRGESPMTVSPQYFRYLREHDEPPPHTQVWFGAVAAHESGHLIGFLSTRWVGIPPQQPVGISGVFTIGDLLFQVYFPVRAAGTEPETVSELWFSGDLAEILIPIWPVIIPEVVWPPKIVIGVDDLERLWPAGGFIQPVLGPPVD